MTWRQLSDHFVYHMYVDTYSFVCFAPRVLVLLDLYVYLQKNGPQERYTFCTSSVFGATSNSHQELLTTTLTISQLKIKVYISVD